MAAAMDVVKNDVPEPLRNLVDENDFAKKLWNYYSPQAAKLQ
jgi:hypothetical protein